MKSIQNRLAERTSRKNVIRSVRQYCAATHSKTRRFRPGDRIPYAGRVTDYKEVVALVHSALDCWLTAGRFADQFERRLSAFLGVKFCSLVNSGSSANLLAFMALTSPSLGDRQIRRGDEVITVAAAFPTTVAPIIQYGAIPVFVDIQLPNYNIDCSKLKQALSRRTKAVMLAHTLGNPFNLTEVKRFCLANGLWLIEDNCDSLGSRYRYNNHWSYTGTIGDLGTSSFYPPHHITTGEGGAVYTNNPTLKRLVDCFRDWGRDCWCRPGTDNTCNQRFLRRFGQLPLGYDHKYVYSHFGYNLKATDMQAAVGCAQLNKLSAFIAARNRNWETLRTGLSPLSDYVILPEPTDNSIPSWFGFLLTATRKAGLCRDEIIRHLEARGVQTRMLFAGNVTKHPCFDEMRKGRRLYRISGSLANTDRVMCDSFWIGVYPGLSQSMIAHMIHCFIELKAAHAIPNDSEAHTP